MDTLCNYAFCIVLYVKVELATQMPLKCHLNSCSFVLFSVFSIRCYILCKVKLNIGYIFLKYT